MRPRPLRRFEDDFPQGILVSNEVGSGVVPAYALSRRFRDVVGEINQRVANVADTVLLMVAGLPLILKGSLEGGHR
jgi:adenosylcobinamide kinase/adenosylcobinamide-phosphate guanylyltransferase